MAEKSKPKEVRQARAFLQQRGFRTADIPPRMFADTAKKAGKTFSDLLKTIARLKMGGQGEGQSGQTKAFLADTRKRG